MCRDKAPKNIDPDKVYAGLEKASANAEEAKLKKETLEGVGNHPLSPEADLRPDNEKNMSVADMKNIDGPDGKKYKLISSLGNQEGMRDKLKEVVGDFDKDPAALARGEAYLQKIKHMPNADGKQPTPEDLKSGSMGGIGPGDAIATTPTWAA